MSQETLPSSTVVLLIVVTLLLHSQKKRFEVEPLKVLQLNALLEPVKVLE